MNLLVFFGGVCPALKVYLILRDEKNVLTERTSEKRREENKMLKLPATL